MGNAPCISVQGALFKTFLILKSKTMLELFIELTNQIFWEGYAQQLAIENPVRFQLELNDFINTHQN